MITKLRRLWCRMAHTSPNNVMFGGGSTYRCRRCLQVWENPMLDGPAPSTLTVPAVAVQSMDVAALERLWRDAAIRRLWRQL